jgi:hypothetical protein
VRRLRKRDEDGRNAQLMICQVLDEVRVEAEHTKLVRAHNPRKELHKQNLVVERISFVVTIQHVVQLL